MGSSRLNDWSNRRQKLCDLICTQLMTAHCRYTFISLFHSAELFIKSALPLKAYCHGKLATVHTQDMKHYEPAWVYESAR